MEIIVSDILYIIILWIWFDQVPTACGIGQPCRVYFQFNKTLTIIVNYLKVNFHKLFSSTILSLCVFRLKDWPIRWWRLRLPEWKSNTVIRDCINIIWYGRVTVNTIFSSLEFDWKNKNVKTSLIIMYEFGSAQTKWHY